MIKFTIGSKKGIQEVNSIFVYDQNGTRFQISESYDGKLGINKAALEEDSETINVQPVTMNQITIS